MYLVLPQRASAIRFELTDAEGSLTYNLFLKGKRGRKNTDIGKDIFLFTNDMNKIVMY